jgi:hypothetical protein
LDDMIVAGHPALRLLRHRVAAAIAQLDVAPPSRARVPQTAPAMRGSRLRDLDSR